MSRYKNAHVNVGEAGRTAIILLTPQSSGNPDLERLAEELDMAPVDNDGVEPFTDKALVYVDDGFSKLLVEDGAVPLTADAGFSRTLRKTRERALLIVGTDVLGTRDPGEYLSQAALRPM